MIEIKDNYSAIIFNEYEGLAYSAIDFRLPSVIEDLEYINGIVIPFTKFRLTKNKVKLISGNKIPIEWINNGDKPEYFNPPMKILDNLSKERKNYLKSSDRIILKNKNLIRMGEITIASCSNLKDVSIYYVSSMDEFYKLLKRIKKLMKCNDILRLYTDKNNLISKVYYRKDL